MFAAFALALMLGVPATASASFHEMKIREISAGTGANDSYVEVQMYSPGQNSLNLGGKLYWCTDATCSATTQSGPFGAAPLPNGANQSTVLFGDTGLASKDFEVDLNLESFAAGGAMCWRTDLTGFNDCVSWGTFTGNASLTTTMSDAGATSGTSFPGALPGGTNAMRRDISANCATLLEAADDTNNSNANFATAARDPRPNSVTPTEMPCPPPPSGGGGGGTTTSPIPLAPTPTASVGKKCKTKKRSASAAKKCKRRK